MAITHNFWILPPDYNPTTTRILQERYNIWGVVPLREPYYSDAVHVRLTLSDFCVSKQRKAIHVNNRMMLDALPNLLDVRTLRNGWLPSRGISIQEMSVIPTPEIPRLMLAIIAQPPSAAWRRLYELCGQAYAKDCYILHQSVLPQDLASVSAPS